MENLSSYDIFFIIVIGISGVLAMLKGGISSLLSMSTWFIAAFISKNFAGLLENFMPQSLSNTFLRGIIAYVLAFLIAAVAIRIIQMLFNSGASAMGLGGLNRLIGLLFGVARGAIICALIVILAETFHLDTTHSWKEAKLSPIITPAISLITNSVPNDLLTNNTESAAPETTKTTQTPLKAKATSPTNSKKPVKTKSQNKSTTK